MWLMLIWFGLNLVPAVYYWFGRNGPAKSATYPLFAVGSALAFIGAVVLSVQLNSRGLIELIVAVMIVAWLNVRQAAFCGHCGRMVNRGPFTRKAVSCPRCSETLPARSRSAVA